MTKYRALITRANGLTEEWGFYQMNLHESGALLLRTVEDTEGFDQILPHGQWLELSDVTEED